MRSLIRARDSSRAGMILTSSGSAVIAGSQVEVQEAGDLGLALSQPVGDLGLSQALAAQAGSGNGEQLMVAIKFFKSSWHSTPGQLNENY